MSSYVIDLPNKSFKRIEKIAKYEDMSKRDVIIRSLCLYGIIHEARKKNAEISLRIVENGKTKNEIVF